MISNSVRKKNTAPPRAIEETERADRSEHSRVPEEPRRGVSPVLSLPKDRPVPVILNEVKDPYVPGHRDSSVNFRHPYGWDSSVAPLLRMTPVREAPPPCPLRGLW